MKNLKRFTAYLLFFVIISSISIFLYYISGPKPLYCSKAFAEREHRVVMFSTKWCPYCKKARKLFNEYAIAYCEYDVNASIEIQDVFTELGGNGVPLILIGDEIFYGFSSDGIRNALIRQGMLQQSR